MDVNSRLGGVFLVAIVTGAHFAFGLPLETEEGKTSVKLTLFYESFCQYCADFISNQLHSTWLHFQERLRLEIVPAGTNLLLLDILQACAIQHACGGNGTLDCPTPNLKKVMDYLSCVEKDHATLENHIKCAPKSGLDLESLGKCATSNEGVILQNKYTKKIKDFKPPIKLFPTIYINDKYDDKVQNQAQEDLMKLISSMLK